MTDRVPADVIYMDVFMYWMLTMIVVMASDFYARRKLGRKSLGYKSLKVHKYIAFLIAAIATILFVASVAAKIEVTRQMMTYFGVPYFIACTYYLTTVFRRLKAERIRRL